MREPHRTAGARPCRWRAARCRRRAARARRACRRRGRHSTAPACGEAELVRTVGDAQRLRRSTVASNCVERGRGDRRLQRAAAHDVHVAAGRQQACRSRRRVHCAVEREGPARHPAASAGAHAAARRRAAPSRRLPAPARRHRRRRRRSERAAAQHQLARLQRGAAAQRAQRPAAATRRASATPPVSVSSPRCSAVRSQPPLCARRRRRRLRCRCRAARRSARRGCAARRRAASAARSRCPAALACWIHSLRQPELLHGRVGAQLRRAATDRGRAARAASVPRPIGGDAAGEAKTSATTASPGTSIAAQLPVVRPSRRARRVPLQRQRSLPQVGDDARRAQRRAVER